jgi:hypothetical protein
VKYKFIKTDDGQIIIPKSENIARKLGTLKPGHYFAEISLRDTRLERMKKYYFLMESHLANHLGIKKRELHAAIQDSNTLGRAADGSYESVADIKDCDTMMARIYEFQHWAATYHNYQLEPYKEEEEDGNTRKPDEDPATGLQLDPSP